MISFYKDIKDYLKNKRECKALENKIINRGNCVICNKPPKGNIMYTNKGVIEENCLRNHYSNNKEKAESIIEKYHLDRLKYKSIN